MTLGYGHFPSIVIIPNLNVINSSIWFMLEDQNVGYWGVTALKRILAFMILTFLLLTIMPGCGGSEPAESIEERGPTNFCLVDPCAVYEVDLAAEPEVEAEKVEAENQNITTADNNQDINTPEEPTVEIEDIDTSDDSLGFDFDLFHEVFENNRGDNVIISTVSIKLALAMAYNGAIGEAKEAMAKVMQFEGLSLEEVNRQLHDLMVSLEAGDTDVQVEIANSLWSHTDLDFYEDFVERCEHNYDAETASLDFYDPSSVDIINKWVEEKTHGKIDKIIESFEGEVFALINALYFKALWSKQFDEDATIEENFHLLNGETKKLPMMRQKGVFPYYENQDFQAVSLPYGDKRMSMYILLPKPEKDFNDFISSLNAGNWSGRMQKFSQEKIVIVLPRLKTGFDIELNDALKSLGMEPAFCGNALGGMAPLPQCIGRVLHKTVLEVNEAGTEGAAATYIAPIGISPLPSSEPIMMRVDRPFFLAIRDSLTGELLFMGSIIDPLLE
jgi:serine protease inhibitor